MLNAGNSFILHSVAACGVVSEHPCLADRLRRWRYGVYKVKRFMAAFRCCMQLYNIFVNNVRLLNEFGLVFGYECSLETISNIYVIYTKLPEQEH